MGERPAAKWPAFCFLDQVQNIMNDCHDDAIKFTEFVVAA